VSGLTLPKTLAAGSSTTATVKFAPTTTGAASGSVAFVSNASNSPATVTLSGTGSTATVAHAVDLTWSASTTSTVVGYKVYRGSQSGGPYALLTTSAVSGSTYTDNSVQSGQTYYYAVSAVDASGAESALSNEATAAIPIP